MFISFSPEEIFLVTDDSTTTQTDRSAKVLVLANICSIREHFPSNEIMVLYRRYFIIRVDRFSIDQINRVSLKFRQCTRTHIYMYPW